MATQEREVCFVSQSPSPNLVADTVHQPKMQALSERMGAHVITFMTWGHIDNQVIPGWFATSGTMHFFMDVLNLSAWDVLQMFEQWACAKSLSKFTFLSAILKFTRHHRFSSAQHCPHHKGTNRERRPGRPQYVPYTICIPTATNWMFSMGHKQQVQEANQNELCEL